MMTKHGGIVLRASALVLALILGGCSPKVYELYAGEAQARPINILIMGDGFRRDELGSYRAATERLSEALLTTWPFCRVSQRINIYRIDIVDPEGGISLGSCNYLCSESPRIVIDPSFRESEPPEAVSGFRSTWSEDFEVTRCQSGGACASMWPTTSGIQKAFETARYAPNIEAVVVLANSRADAGNGYWAVYGGSQRLAVVTVPMSGSTGDWDISPSGKSTFVHELGHALGLVDEYAYGPHNTPAVAADRNVWFPSQPGPWNSIEPIPWTRLLPGSCDSLSMKTCCGYFGPLTCEECSALTVAQARCSFVPGVCSEASLHCPGPGCVAPPTCMADPTKLCAPTMCDKYSPAWEGAAYKAVGRYRSAHTCLMSTLSHPQLCNACALHLWSVFCDPATPGDCDDPSQIVTQGCS